MIVVFCSSQSDCGGTLSPIRNQPPIEKALCSIRESKNVDFKSSFDTNEKGEWCEIIKDLVAIANSGGGVILVGVEDDGLLAPAKNALAILALDPAVLTDKVAKYTGVQFDGFEIIEAIRDSQAVAAIAVQAATVPLIFEKPGTYAIDNGKQRTAFGAGTFYVRHGAKSEPGTSADLAKVIAKIVQKERKEWSIGVRRVISAPAGSTVSVHPIGVKRTQEPSAAPMRITTDPSAPEYRLLDSDTTHPFRQKELIAELNAILPGNQQINQFDIRAIRIVWDIDKKAHFFHKARFATAQYSSEFRDWLLEQFDRDPKFFLSAREEFTRRAAKI
jgi:hypothetical protein